MRRKTHAEIRNQYCRVNAILWCAIDAAIVDEFVSQEERRLRARAARLRAAYRRMIPITWIN
jgi:hypothetical protein